MPTGTSSPVKRPGLGRRAVSSHAVVTRSNSNSELSQSPTSKTTGHKAHRPHVVGGGRHHHRNPSTGKNVNKLQRFQLPAESSGRHHHRKKSAPATPVASPKEKAHVRWDGGTEDHPKNHSMKRNNSTPALRRNNSGFGKKALVGDRPLSSAGKKKTVGFELGDYENDDAEWEDTTQSPESTRRNSVVPSNHSAENAQVLVDPLTFVKRAYPQVPRATSLPDSITNRYLREQTIQEEERQEEEEEEDQESDNDKTEPTQQGEQGDIANRLLSPSHSARAPPAMTSISAMAKPTDSASRNASSVNLTAAHDGARRTFSATNMRQGNQAPAASSSMEGGVSRFIPSNKSGPHSSSRTDSNPNTPSSFLPHYHPQTPPSPKRGSATAIASPAPSRGADLSRTQQKLWLQRTATLNNSPPESHSVSSAVSPSNLDPTFIATNGARSGPGAYDANGALNGGSRIRLPGQDNEARTVRKAYEKSSLELNVVRRFQSPTGDSFNRLRVVTRPSQESRRADKGAALGKPVKSAPSLPLLQHGRHPSRLGSSSESRLQLPDPNSSASEDPASHGEASTHTSHARKSSHPSQRILSSSEEAVHNGPGDQDSEDYPPVPEIALMLRRMWDSREVATSG
ncbi:hypothetical protein N7478_009950 [Penicillium angulare]|uniref:uncharacterized protein n=1 Tax=Penicillium angulare TaxID=116970 RepID=UPI00253FCA13|nr:uncharacterized protein N7478_009950 [Penicillium angulare]KAJ5267142.1 hypothetical protein N7478_009950 [Penicillium angulare]